MNTFFKRGHRLFTVASLLAIIVAILHTLGLFNEPYDDDWAAAEEAMRAATVDVGPLTISFERMFIGAWIQIGVLLAMLGIKNLALLLVLPSGSTGKVIRAMSLVDGIAYAGLATLFAVYVIPPALISFALLSVAYFAAAAGARGVK